MESRYSGWAGRPVDVGRFDWERVVKKCTFKQPATKLIALLLATYASEDGSSVRPGRERLSIVAGMSAKHVSTQLGKLEELGLVFKLHNGSSYGRRGGLASVYQLTVPSDLYRIYLEDPSELEQLWHEAAWFVLTEHVNPSSHVSEEEGKPSSHVLKPNPEEHVNSESEQGNSGAEQGNSEAEQVNPSSPHQAFTPLKKHQPKNINPSISVTQGGAPARELNALAERPSLEDERSRQLAALEQRIAEQKKAS